MSLKFFIVRLFVEPFGYCISLFMFSFGNCSQSVRLNREY